MHGRRAREESMTPHEAFAESTRPRWTELPLRIQGVDLYWSEPLRRRTTFRVGGPVACLAEPRTESALAELLAWARAELVPFRILGEGSNVLAPDAAWDALIIRPRRACGAVEATGEDGATLYVGAGARLAEWIGLCVRHGLGGVEHLVGIPGSVGGALVMNAGTREGSIADALAWVDALDEEGRKVRLHKRELPIAYRRLGLPAGWTALGAGLRLHPAPVSELKARMRESAVRRRMTQPLGRPSAGCIFRNPTEAPAGALIERAGLKGFRVGDAQVSEKHANWIINLGQARACDIVSVMETIEKRVLDRFGIRLKREIEVWAGEEAQPL